MTYQTLHRWAVAMSFAGLFAILFGSIMAVVSALSHETAGGAIGMAMFFNGASVLGLGGLAGMMCRIVKVQDDRIATLEERLKALNGPSGPAT